MKRSQGITLQRHRELGAAFGSLADDVDTLVDEISRAYPKRVPANPAAFAFRERLRALRRELENAMCDFDHHFTSNDANATGVYFAPK